MLIDRGSKLILTLSPFLKYFVLKLDVSPKVMRPMQMVRLVTGPNSQRDGRPRSHFSPATALCVSNTLNYLWQTTSKCFLLHYYSLCPFSFTEQRSPEQERCFTDQSPLSPSLFKQPLNSCRCP